MPMKLTTLTSTAVPKRVLDGTVNGADPIDASLDLPCHQVVIQASANVTVGTSSSNAGTGVAVTTTLPLVLGPFREGPVKLSQLWVVGAATVTILAVTY